MLICIVQDKNHSAILDINIHSAILAQLYFWFSKHDKLKIKIPKVQLPIRQLNQYFLPLETKPVQIISEHFNGSLLQIAVVCCPVPSTLTICSAIQLDIVLITAIIPIRLVCTFFFLSILTILFHFNAFLGKPVRFILLSLQLFASKSIPDFQKNLFLLVFL